MQWGIGIYVKNSKEAVALYCEAFGFELGYHVLNDEGNYYHSELVKDGQPYLAVAEASEDTLPGGMNMAYTNPVELGYTAENNEDFDRAYTLLKEQGKILMEACELPWSPWAATVMDKYGVRWYITLPQHRNAKEN